MYMYRSLTVKCLTLKDDFKENNFLNKGQKREEGFGDKFCEIDQRPTATTTTEATNYSSSNLNSIHSCDHSVCLLNAWF